ncbi:MAG TPA: hypothetical protein VGI19_10700 [Candidatus Cybelea sp.]|jgi:hypothetical protein
MLRHTLLAQVLAAALLAFPAAAAAADAPISDSDYVTKVSTAAPAAVVKGAAIVQMGTDGAMRTIQTGSNGFTCMLLAGREPMCADANAMGWMRAIMTHGTPPTTTGFVYMLAGDEGASNSDPYASAQTADNHWVKTGPHVMILGPSVKGMGYPMVPDPDPTKPYVMWPNSPYAHLMIPVSAGP